MYSQTNNVVSYVRIGTGATPTYQSGASDYAWIRYFAVPGSVGTSNSAGDNKILWTSNGSVSNSATRTANGELIIFNPSQSTDLHQISIAELFIDATGSYAQQTMSGWYLSTTAVTAVRFLMSSGNIQAGTFKLYGIK